MREVPKIRSWVVYETETGPRSGMRSVCTFEEWKVLETSGPHSNRLIKDDIVDEAEAEKLARGASGDVKARAQALRPKFE